MSMRAPIALALAALLGAAAAVLVACGSSGRGLIPEANAGPLQSDFEAVAQAAQAGNGDCTATTEAINKTEQDFAALPATVDQALRSRLSKGIENLRERALALCAQPLAQPASTSAGTNTGAQRTAPAYTPAKTQPASTAPATTQTTSTQTTPASTPTTTTPLPNNGGAAAPSGEAPSSAGQGAAGEGESGGAGAPEGTK